MMRGLVTCPEALEWAVAFVFNLLRSRVDPTTVLALNIEEAGHNCWVLEVYLLGI